MSKDKGVDLWVIGENSCGQLGLHHTHSVKELTSWNLVNKQLNIKQILVTKDTIIYIDHNNQHWVSGSNAYGKCGLNHISDDKENNKYNEITKPTKLSYFDYNSITISAIFTNSCGAHTFWLTSDNQLYCNGDDKDVKYRKEIGQKEPQLIKVSEEGKVIKLVSALTFWMALIQSSNKYEMTTVISNWSRLSNIDIPDDVLNFLVTLCSTTSVYTTINIFQDKQTSPLFHKIGLFDDENVSIIDIDCGGQHCLFLASNGNVWSFGWGWLNGNGDGQLGLGHKDVKLSQEPQIIAYFQKNQIKIKSLACGWRHSLAVDEKGNVYSWGGNRYGQCGDGTQKSILTPKLIKKLVDIEVAEVKCGTYHSYVKSVDGRHWLFGSNDYKQCLVMVNINKILEPVCVDDFVMQRLDGKEIKSVHLTTDRTYVVC